MLFISFTAVFAACKKTKHTHSFGAEWQSDSAQHWRQCSCGEKSDVANHAFAASTGAKPWQVVPVCSCGYKKAAETDYTRMNNETGVARLFAELSDNEGNYIIDVASNEGNEANGDETDDVYICHWEANGKTSYACYTDFGETYFDYWYRSIAENSAILVYGLYDGDTDWSVNLYHDAYNTWLDDDGWHYFIEEEIKPGDFKAGDTANTYVLKTPQDIWGCEDTTCEIKFSKNNIIMVFSWYGEINYTYTYTITLGNSTKTIPQDVIDATKDYPIFMFGVPDEFRNYSDFETSGEWAWTGNQYSDLRKLFVAQGFSGNGTVNASGSGTNDYTRVKFNGQMIYLDYFGPSGGTHAYCSFFNDNPSLFTDPNFFDGINGTMTVEDPYVYTGYTEYFWSFAGVEKVDAFVAVLEAKGWTLCTNHSASGCKGICHSWDDGMEEYGTHVSQLNDEMWVMFYDDDEMGKKSGYQVYLYR